MARKKSKLKSFILVVFVQSIIAVIVGGSATYSLFNSGQSFSVTGDNINIPKFGNIACEKTDRPTNDLLFKPYTTTSGIFSSETFKVDVENSNGNFIGTFDDLDIYCSAEYDNVYTNECEIEVLRTKTQIGSKEYLCPANFRDVNECTEITLGNIPANTWTKVDDISREQAIAVRDFTNAEVFSDEIKKGDLIYRSSRDEYGLISLNDGRKEKLNSCDLRDIVRLSGKDILSEDLSNAKSNGIVVGTVLKFGQVINYVTGFEPVPNSLRLIENKQYYTYGGGVKYPIKQGESGAKYVDLREQIKDAKIICDPASIYCINDGTKIDIQFGKEAECKFEGEITDWIPSSEKNNYIEKRKCVEGSWKILESKPIPTCSASESINDNYDCVQGTIRDVKPVNQDTETSYTALWILGLGMIGLLGSAYVSKQIEG